MSGVTGRAAPQAPDALDKKEPSFRVEGDSSPRQALGLPVSRSIYVDTREGKSAKVWPLWAGWAVDTRQLNGS